MTDQQDPKRNGNRGGAASFCIPKVALTALIDAKATAYEICTYLVLARFTEESGQYSTASISAVNRYTGANKMKGGPVDRAIQRLKTIHAKTTTMVSNGRSGKAHAMIAKSIDLGPILYERDAWCEQTGEILPDGPYERAKVLHVLPHFDEPSDERIWFGGNLVTGVGEFKQPLKDLKNAGDVAARLLLRLYQANDMETWGGVRPVGDDSGPWKHYEPVGDDIHLSGMRLIRAKGEGTVARINAAISNGNDKAYWDALEALQSSGLAYETVMVLNRGARKVTFANSGGEYSAIPDDAEPLYELDARSQHGYKPDGEEGVGGATAATAGALGYSVATAGGRFDGTYAAFVPKGHGAMIAGIFRLRFRVSNPKNAGVKGAWAGIHERNRDAFNLVQRLRTASGLPQLDSPWDKKRQATQAVDERLAGLQEATTSVDNNDWCPF